jgi:hypothetical protein
MWSVPGPLGRAMRPVLLDEAGKGFWAIAQPARPDEHWPELNGAGKLQQQNVRSSMPPEVELIRALAEDLALEILVSYTPEDFQQADFTSLGKAAVYLTQHDEGPGPALEELIKKVQHAQGT